MLVLKNKIKVIVPKEDNAGRKIDSKMLERSITRATDIFGGATVYDGTGYWTSPGGRLLTDNVNVIEWSYNLIDLIEKNRLWDASCMVGWVVAALIIFHDQEAVSVEVDGVLYIIDAQDITNKDDYKDADEAKKLIEKIMKGEF